MRTIRQAFIQHLRILTNDYHEKATTYVQETHPKKRTQFRSVSFRIEQPLETKEIEGVPARNIPTIMTVEDGELYFQHLMLSDRGDYNYSYGERIVEQLGYVTESLKAYSNNAQIVVIRDSDHNIEHRPCLQLIDLKRLPEGLLDMHVFFRSWDIFAMPMNLVGLSYLFEHIAVETGLKVNHLYAYSSGLNIREEMYDLGQKIGKYLQI